MTYSDLPDDIESIQPHESRTWKTSLLHCKLSQAFFRALLSFCRRNVRRRPWTTLNTGKQSSFASSYGLHYRACWKYPRAQLYCSMQIFWISLPVHKWSWYSLAGRRYSDSVRRGRRVLMRTSVSLVDMVFPVADLAITSSVFVRLGNNRPYLLCKLMQSRFKWPSYT